MQQSTTNRSHQSDKVLRSTTIAHEFQLLCVSLFIPTPFSSSSSFILLMPGCVKSAQQQIFCIALFNYLHPRLNLLNENDFTVGRICCDLNARLSSFILFASPAMDRAIYSALNFFAYFMNGQLQHFKRSFVSVLFNFNFYSSHPGG